MTDDTDSDDQNPTERTTETPSNGADGPESAADANRRRFREALERKRSGPHGEGMSADPRAPSPHASPAKPQRTFRRKSG